MIVYIILRKISEWSLSTFYSDVHVDGSENVPKDGPLLVYVPLSESCCLSLPIYIPVTPRCANHHNELIDIATLSKDISGVSKFGTGV
jgi:glycerol-3-phosphate O-acyltransferase / dihydroxyacetone phosphate acyltransferase